MIRLACLQAGFALQKRLGVVVEAETGGVAVAGEAVALPAEELFARAAAASARLTRKSMEASGKAR